MTIYTDLNDAPASHRALEIGKAAEHLVVADLILSGYRAFLTEQGLPYDAVVDVRGRLLRLQVKSTMRTRPSMSRARGGGRDGYVFSSAGYAGKDGKKRLTEERADVVAFVAIDIRTIAYRGVGEVGTCVVLMPPGYKHPRPTSRWAQGVKTVDQWSFCDLVKEKGW